MILNQIPLTTATSEAAPADSTVSAAAEKWSALDAVSFDDLINRIASTLVDFAIHLAVAILIFYVGKFLIKKLYTFVAGVMLRRRIDKSLTTFVLSLVNIVLYFILVVTVIGILGINTSSFIAIFASAGVAIGMALSGTLQNFAGGVLILLLKPYKVGDYIEAQGYAGVVKEIQIFSTIISTPDNKSIIIPNGPLSTGSINNWSREQYRRIDWTVSISYGDDVATARKAILELLAAESRIVSSDRSSETETTDTADADSTTARPEADSPARRSLWSRLSGRRRKAAARQAAIDAKVDIAALAPKIDHSPQVLLASMAASSIDLSVRAWVRSTDYWDVYFDMNERFYNTLPQFGLSFPFPQMDIHFPDNTSGAPNC